MPKLSHLQILTVILEILPTARDVESFSDTVWGQVLHP